MAPRYRFGDRMRDFHHDVSIVEQENWGNAVYALARDYFAMGAPPFIRAVFCLDFCLNCLPPHALLFQLLVLLIMLLPIRDCGLSQSDAYFDRLPGRLNVSLSAELSPDKLIELPSRLNAARNSGDFTSFNLSSSAQISCRSWLS